MIATPLVTIGLPLYNAQRTIAEAIASVLGQTYQNWELLIMDDGSSDASGGIACGFNDARIRWISDGQNKGISWRLNQALDLARGEYFCRMDADDMSFPQRLQVQVSALQADSTIDLVASSVMTFTSGLDITGVIEVATDHAVICARPWNGFHFPHPSWMGKTSWFRQFRYVSQADGAEDQHLLYRAFARSRFHGIPEVLLAYRDDRQSFRKLLSRRLRFWKVFMMEACRQRRYRDALIVSLRQPAKIAADLLFMFGGIRAARNRLVPPGEQQVAAWHALRAIIRSRQI
ncbi:glycosyltransferase [Herbaspirillum sp. AP02]|uniref:glycosyltransferase family 2 protein n=1 Tax=unclassified Herbaspirillum TaxID=2624150 RepID=UPI0015D9FD3C|nr:MULTISPECIES: glycosyltransferase [unclassified Herbaspirillum]MBG7620189.1 glycosyltransferase [Herbaspirillum sp. AP02]NZD67653.1 glycosyltransferase [Herbaspirillum sp. AP21]